MCREAQINEETKKITLFSVEVIAPCGEVVSILTRDAMRPISSIDSESLINSTREFFKNLGFIGQDWAVRITKTTKQGNDYCYTEIKVFR